MSRYQDGLKAFLYERRRPGRSRRASDLKIVCSCLLTIFGEEIFWPKGPCHYCSRILLSKGGSVPISNFLLNIVVFIAAAGQSRKL